MKRNEILGAREEEQEEEHKTLHQELLSLLRERFRAFLRWMKPKPEDPTALQIGKFLLKLPVLLFVILLSPVAFIILAFTFIVIL